VLLCCIQKLDQNFPAIDEPSDAMVDLAISIMKSVLFLEHPPRVEKGLPWVKSNFARFGLLDEQVVFLQGWFSETLPNAPGLSAISVLRLDGDTFESTIDALNVCYPKLSPGGECAMLERLKGLLQSTATIERWVAVLALHESQLVLVNAMLCSMFLGFCIIDDYWSFDDCKQAVDEYRTEHGVDELLVRIDGLSCFWQKKAK
jgi:O-methyltransferase